MRLNPREADAIKRIAISVFGYGSKVYLFGSRVHDNVKGGDIDLYIKPSLNNDIFSKKIDFLVQLKSEIGDQKIDVVISKDTSRIIEKEAIQTGIEL